MEPRLLDGKEPDMIKSYIKIVKLKLAEWLKALIAKETSEFIKREYSPETDAEGLYILSGSLILFKMFNQQIDVVSSSSRGSLLTDVVTECIATLEEYQRYWITLLDAEFKKFEDKAKGLVQGLPEFIMALANDCYRSTEFCENALTKLEGASDEPYTSQLKIQIDTVSDGFLKVAKRAYTILIEITLLDCKPAFIQMHCPQWYEQDVMRMIVGTLEDYCKDFQTHLTSHLFTKLVNDLIDLFAVKYLECMRNKQAKFKIGAAERMRGDQKRVQDYFSTLKNGKRVIQSLDVVDKVITFVEANPRLVFVEFYNLWKNYMDVPYLYVEELVLKREDLDKAQGKELLESIKEKMKEDPPRDYVPVVTVFAKVYMGKMK